jgi:hypothetical protein
MVKQQRRGNPKLVRSRLSSAKRARATRASPYPCGVMGADVQCRTVAIDRHRRAVASCTANGRDLSEIMVSSGWALDFTRDGLYFAAETEARQDWANRLGVRRGNASRSCPIKLDPRA